MDNKYSLYIYYILFIICYSLFVIIYFTLLHIGCPTYNIDKIIIYIIYILVKHNFVPLFYLFKLFVCFYTIIYNTHQILYIYIYLPIYITERLSILVACLINSWT